MADIQVNLAFLMDCTASMESWIQAAKDQIVRIIDNTVLQHETVDVRVGFVGYRDYGDDTRFTCVDFTDASTVLRAIRNVHADGGDDFAEDVAGGLLQIRNLSWRPNDVNMIIHIADAPAHGRQFHSARLSDRFPRGDPNGIDPRDLISYFSAQGYDYTFVKINDTADTMIELFSDCYVHNAVFKVVDLRPQGPRTPVRLSPNHHELDTTLLLTPEITRAVMSSIHRYTASQDPVE